MRASMNRGLQRDRISELIRIKRIRRYPGASGRWRSIHLIA